MDVFDIARLFFLLMVAHAVADFTFQTETMAKLKNRHNKPDEVPNGQKFTPCWAYWLSAHGLVHGGLVYLATGNLALGIVETTLHVQIDFAKCEGVTNPHIDQFLHVLCKVGYVAFIAYFGGGRLF